MAVAVAAVAVAVEEEEEGEEEPEDVALLLRRGAEKGRRRLARPTLPRALLRATTPRLPAKERGLRMTNPRATPLSRTA